MDIVLRRVLSLIEKGETGKYAHGAKVRFAKSIGYNDGSIVSMWENGASTSYVKKLHEIADVYNVSVEWLKGETDDPAPKKPAAQTGDGEREQLLSAIDRALFDLTEEQKLEALRYIWGLQNKEGEE